MYETPFRNYDPCLGRRLSPDPIQHPWQGSYSAFNNNPIYFVDPMGLEGDESDDKNGITADPKGAPEDPSDGDTYQSPSGAKWKYSSQKDKWVANGWNKELETVHIVEEDPNKPISGVEARMNFMRFKMRMESPLKRATLKSVSEIDRAVRQAGLSQSQLSADITRDNVIRDLNNLANFTKTGLNWTSIGLTVAGGVLVVIPEPSTTGAGVTLMTYGTYAGATSSGISATQNVAKGNYNRAVIDGVSIGPTVTKGQVISRMGTRYRWSHRHEKIIDAGSSLTQTGLINSSKGLILEK